MIENNYHIFTDVVTRELGERLARLGFVRWQPDQRTETKIVCFRRKRPPETHLLDLRFDKYQRYRCGVGVGKIAGSTALTLFKEERPADEISLSALPDRCVLNGNSLLGRGQFVAPLHCRIRGPKQSAESIVRKIADQLGVIETWFESGEIGPGLFCFSLGQRQPARGDRNVM